MEKIRIFMSLVNNHFKSEIIFVSIRVYNIVYGGNVSRGQHGSLGHLWGCGL